jgi:hypothetical protein
LAVGQIDLTWVQNGPVRFVQNIAYKKTIFSLHIYDLMSRGLKTTNRRIVKTVTQCHQKLLKTKPGYILYPVSNPKVNLSTCTRFRSVKTCRRAHGTHQRRLEDGPTACPDKTVKRRPHIPVYH